MAKHSTDLPHSSSIQRCEHDDELNEMHITFATGSKHKYKGVTKAEYDELCKSDSPGKHFHMHVRKRYESEKVD